MIGHTINNYTLERKLGEGGMGDVYFARHNRIDRIVAIKVLHKNLFANESIRIRFKNEANALIKLGHPNIVKIYDYVEQDEFACLIMEYIEGFTLDDYITKVTGPLPAPKATHIICSVLDAVQYAHDKNILHRDIKPGNIMVSKDGRVVRIMDFSIAKFTDAVNLKTTHANAQLGTPFYMSPEQVKGIAYTASSDIYSLGVTLFEMVTGKCPYLGITNLFELQSKIVNEPLPPTNKYYPDVSSNIQEAIKIATNKTPELRFKSCYAFKTYLSNEEKLSLDRVQAQTQQQTSMQSQVKEETVSLQHSEPQYLIEPREKSNKGIYLFALIAALIFAVIVYSFVKKDITIHSPQADRSDPTEKAVLSASEEKKNIKSDLLKPNNPEEANPGITSKKDSSKLIERIAPFPTPPTRERVISDLVGEKISNELIFSKNDAQDIACNIVRENNGQQYNALVTFKIKNIPYKIMMIYREIQNQYTCEKRVFYPDSAKKMQPLPPSDSCDGPPAPSEDKVLIDLKTQYLLKGGNKYFDIADDDVNKIGDYIVKSQKYSGECTIITFNISFTINGKLCNCQVIYTEVGNVYRYSNTNH